MRSHIGAKLAARVAIQELSRFAADYGDPSSLPDLAQIAAEHLPRSLTRAWQSAVQSHVNDQPFAPDLLHDMAARATIEAATRLRRAVYHHAFRLGTLAFRALGPGEAVTVFTRHVEAVHDALYTRLTELIPQPIMFGLLLAFALVIHPLLTALRHPSPDVRYAVCNALVHLYISDAIAPLEQLAREDRATTSWGASVADAALRAAQSIASARPTRADNEFARVSALLSQHQQET